MVHTYNGIYSVIKSNRTVPYAEIWMDLEMATQSKGSQREKFYILRHICKI